MLSREEALLREAAETFNSITALADELRQAKNMVAGALRSDCRIFFCGNGGSAADSQHLAAELLGRFLLERKPWAAVALTVNTSAITAIANDYGYEEVFSRQIRGLGNKGDVLVGISTSGNSPNVVAALTAARSLGILTIGLTGQRESAMSALCDLCIRVPSTHTPRIQEMHIAFGHAMCELVEAELA
jgi:D-sedoheptulose 7-phosphate isomerase